MINFFTIVAIGFFLGVRHATDPDHVIAVTTIVSRQKKISRAALTGAFWGLGHTLTIFIVGTVIIVFGMVIPARVGLSMELSVALMLIVLGVMNVLAFMRSAQSIAKVEGAAAGVVHTHHHSHEDYIHSHRHAHHPEAHSHAAETPLARMDSLFGESQFYRHLRPFLIGVVHGLAGSAAVALLVLTTIRDPRWAIAYLLVFGLGTVAGMVVITMSIASVFIFYGKSHAKFSAHLGLAAGVLSLAFGLLLVYQIGFANGLFAGHPQWTPR
jgi:high-affinity nickel-transport protein